MDRVFLVTSIGCIEFFYDQRGLRRIQISNKGRNLSRQSQDIPAWLSACMQQVKEYLGGNVRTIDRVPLQWHGLTKVRLRILKIIEKIPYGRTRSYKEIAEECGIPRGARAVGQACRANPFPILIPCHRVIQSSGGLGGYSQGLNRKKELLKLEGNFKDI